MPLSELVGAGALARENRANHSGDGRRAQANSGRAGRQVIFEVTNGRCDHTVPAGGQAELDLIREPGFQKFPPRLPEQPIFYPVLSEQYAIQIARDWNTKDERSGFVGYVVRFQVKRRFLDKYVVHFAGSSEHREYWIPAADLGKIIAFRKNGSVIRRRCVNSSYGWSDATRITVSR